MIVAKFLKSVDRTCSTILNLTLHLGSPAHPSHRVDVGGLSGEPVFVCLQRHIPETLVGHGHHVVANLWVQLGEVHAAEQA